MSGSDRSGRGFLILALLSAFLVRLFLALLTIPGFVPQGDEVEYLRYADTLLREGKLDAGPTAYRMPLYPMLLASVQWITGSRVPAYLILNAFLGTAVVALIYLYCRRLAGERAARISLLLSVPNPFLMGSAGYILTENLFVPLVLAFLVALTAADTSKREGGGEGIARGEEEKSPWFLWALAGGFLGLCNLTRPMLLRFGLLLPLLYLVLDRIPGRRVRGAVLALAISVAVLLPWWVRNYAVFGHFIPATTGEGFVWLGCYNEKAFTDPEFLGAWANYETDIDATPFQGKNEYERDRLAKAMARDYATAHLREIPRTLPWKLARTFYWYPHVVHRLYPQGPVRTAVTVWGFLFSVGLVFPMLAWEGWRRLRDRRFAAPFLLCAYFLLIVLATYGSRRFRLPIEGIMIALAAAGWDRLTRDGGIGYRRTPRIPG